MKNHFFPFPRHFPMSARTRKSGRSKEVALETGQSCILISGECKEDRSYHIKKVKRITEAEEVVSQINHLPT